MHSQVVCILPFCPLKPVCSSTSCSRSSSARDLLATRPQSILLELTSHPSCSKVSWPTVLLQVASSPPLPMVRPPAFHPGRSHSSSADDRSNQLKTFPVSLPVSSVLSSWKSSENSLFDLAPRSSRRPSQRSTCRPGRSGTGERVRRNKRRRLRIPLSLPLVLVPSDWA